MAENFYSFKDDTIFGPTLQPLGMSTTQQQQQHVAAQQQAYYCLPASLSTTVPTSQQPLYTLAQAPFAAIAPAECKFLPKPPGFDVNNNSGNQPLLVYPYTGMLNAHQNNLNYSQLLLLNSAGNSLSVGEYTNYAATSNGPSAGLSFYARNRYKPYVLSRPTYANSAVSLNNNSNSRYSSYGGYQKSAMAIPALMATTKSSYSRNLGYNTATSYASNNALQYELEASLKIAVNGNNGNSPITSNASNSLIAAPSTSYNSMQNNLTNEDKQPVTLQITNLDYSMDEINLRTFLLNQLKPITPVLSLMFESNSFAKVTVPDLYYAKQVVANLHRKKIGHKRMLVSYSRDSALTEINTLRCQVAGLLKDVPFHTLSMYKFRELFQSRFKTSISVLDLYKMQDICRIKSDSNDDNKFISLQPELLNGLENSPLILGLQQSVPYCTIHFKREQHQGWAEQEIEPLPNVCMTLAEVQNIIYPLLKQHPGDIPVASLLHCIEGTLNINIKSNENGVNLEHLVCCIKDIQIQLNNFGIKILARVELDKENTGKAEKCCSKNAMSDSLNQISKEVIELIKMSPKCTMKFSRFIPAYHSHFGRQCRVADYGYTKLVELFEALSSVVQIMGDGENRQITLTHRTQIRRFINDMQRVLRTHANKSLQLSELPQIFTQTQNRNFDITDYGVCNIADMMDDLVSSNLVCTVPSGNDILISMPQREQTSYELDKTAVFAGEMVELFGNAPQYTIYFQKFVRSYHYHFAYQCRLSDYGFLRLADLIETISGVLEMELTQDEDKKIRLSAKVARRVFAEQCEELIREFAGSSKVPTKTEFILNLHKKKYGYQIKPQTLGVEQMLQAFEQLPYVELFQKDANSDYWMICHSDDGLFRTQSYRAVKYLLALELKTNQSSNEKPQTDATKELTLQQFIQEFNFKKNESLTETSVRAMKHAIEIYQDEQTKLHCVRISDFMNFIISIVRLLEQRQVLELQQIKRMLNCQLNTTFQFGYPNLYTLLRAYPDLFSMNLGVTQERSQVSLLNNCELRSSSLASKQTHPIPVLKTSNHAFYNKNNNNNRPIRMPLSDLNNNTDNFFQGPPAKTRALSYDYVHNNNNTNSDNGMFYFNVMSQKPQQQHQPQQQSSQNFPLRRQESYTDSSYLSYSGASQPALDNSLNYSNCNKENSFNVSINNFNTSSFNSSSNSSMHSMDLNGSFQPCSYSPSSDAYQQQLANAKLWQRRQYKLFQLQGIPTANLTVNPNLLVKTVTLAAQQTDTAVPQQTGPLDTLFLPEEQYNIDELLSAYEPPKPDTPPTKLFPSCLDPIFATYNRLRNQTMDIKLPDMNNKILSPYSISKLENMNKNKSLFGFEKHW